VKQIEVRRARRKIAPTWRSTEAALIAMDPTTGEVRALVGGRDFKASRFNRATQALRQPGSAFKPFVYASALEAGYSPASLVTRLDEPIQTLQGAWTPEDEHSVGSEMTVRDRVAHVEQSRRGADARGSRHRQNGRAGSQDGHQATCRACRHSRWGRAKSR
jgi:membrane carboxypeptidase/penicillin-binding protein